MRKIMVGAETITCRDLFTLLARFHVNCSLMDELTHRKMLADFSILVEPFFPPACHRSVRP